MPMLEQTRRQFIRGTGAWLGATAFAVAKDPSRSRTVSIFHTTDLHGHILPTVTYEGVEDVGGFARCATQIRQWRKKFPDSLLVDLGDVYQGTPASHATGGKMMIGLFNRLGYDAWTLGNHDFDWGRDVLEENLALSKSPVLTGNLSYGANVPGSLEGKWGKVLPWTLKEVGGFRIALIGLITPGLPFWLAPETLGGVEVTEPLDALRRSVAEAKAAKADAVVVMGHMGFRFQDDFANPLRDLFKKVGGVDFFLGGHTHQNRPFWSIGEVPCSQAAYHGIYCGKLDLTFDLETRKLTDRRAETVLMDGSVPFDPGVMEIALPELKKADEQLARKIGVVTRTIPGTGRGSGVARLFCESFAEALERNKTPVDGIFHGTFGTGDLQEGPLTVGDCWKLLPYENLLVTAEVTGRELAEIVKEDLGESRSDRTLWPFEIIFDSRKEISRFLFKGKEVAPNKRFTIGFNSYDVQSGGMRLMKLRGIVASPAAKRTTTSIDTRGALIDGILNRGEL